MEKLSNYSIMIINLLIFRILFLFRKGYKIFWKYLEQNWISRDERQKIILNDGTRK